MSKKSELELLQHTIKDAVLEFNITELDTGTINQFAENIFDNDNVLAQQIISGEINTVDLRTKLDHLLIDVPSTELNLEPPWEDAVESLEPHWDTDPPGGRIKEDK
jgi:hypothetical protein